MSYDTKKLEEYLDSRVTIEYLEEISDDFIKLLSSKSLNFSIHKKTNARDKASSRVLNNWISKNLVDIEHEDKGRINRFDTIERIWLNILIELRGFGLSLESILRIRKTLFSYEVRGYNFFKFQVINTILNSPQTLIIYKDGRARFASNEVYNDLIERKMLLPHLNFRLEDFIKVEYPNLDLEDGFDNKDIVTNVNKMKLVFFLRTGDFLNMKFNLGDGDIRFIESKQSLLKNNTVLQSISEWSFDHVRISLDSNVDTIIEVN